MLAMSFHQCLIRALSAVKLDLWFLKQFTYVSSGPPESVEEEKWQVQDEEFDIEKEDDNSSELPLQKLRPAYSLLGPISKVPRPRSTSTKDRRQQLRTSNKSNPDIMASFQSFANSVSKLQEAKLEMHRDSERLLVEREARRLDLQLKHTEMLLDTQLYKAFDNSNMEMKGQD
ncbi:hypothetical protein CY35_02G008100 [Sphagnum magellanicum]|nr:hypothetical protein CY35_02G008100 [Sphagnum magellanicum]